MPSYEVKGKGKESNRSRKRVYSAYDESEAITMAKADGTIVESINVLPDDPPTEAQLSFAKDLGIVIPENATKKDVCDIISCRVDHDKPVTDRHKSFARMYLVEHTEFVGKRMLFNMIFASLKHPSRSFDMVAWFTYRVYRQLVKGALDVPIKGPDDPIIIDIARELESDTSVVKSIGKYEGSDLIWFGEWTAPDGSVHIGGSNRTLAYKRASSLLREKLNLPSRASESPQPSHPKATQTLRGHHTSSIESSSFITWIKILIAIGLIALIIWIFK